MGHLFLLPDVCEPPRAKPKAGNKRQRSAEAAAPTAAAPSAAASECGSDEVRSQAESGLGDRSDGGLPDWMQPPEDEDEDEPQPEPEPQRRASAASWERAIGQDGGSHSTGASSQGSMSSFRSGRSASSTRTASKRSRTAVAVGWCSLEDEDGGLG